MYSTEYTKKYYKIKDVAELTGVNQTTLRFWESEFDCIKPLRSATNQRYYTPSDIETIKIINFLIKIRGLKIEAAKREMKLNRDNISKKIEIIRKLQTIKIDLEGILKALKKREEAI